jgi:hypothetical protein
MERTSCVSYRVGLETRSVVLCKSHDFAIRMLLVCIIREEQRKVV